MSRRDPGFMDSDGKVTPLADVMAEKRRKLQSFPKAQREAAYRERAFMQAQLMACECCYPLVKAETPSGHELWCIAEVWRRERDRKESR